MKKEIDGTAIKDIKNLFRLKKENKIIKDRILSDIRIFFELEEEENHYKPIRVSNFWSNNYVEYESKGDSNKTPSVEEYLSRIELFLKEIINNLKKSYTWKIQLTITVTFISAKDNDEVHIMRLKSDNIFTMIHDRAGEVIKELFKSLKNRYQNNLKSMKGIEFVFD